MIRVSLFLLCSFVASAQTVRIGVFTLFRPTEFRVQPASGALVVEAGDTRTMLEGNQTVTLRAAQAQQSIRISGRDGGAADLILSIPGKIHRRFHGVLTVSANGNRLSALIEMDRETAVASAAAAESLPGAGLEALKAQAVATRSYYAASHDRHRDFDFCDTTHCQFLRQPPATGSLADRATAATRGMVLAYAGKPFPALYSATCGGRTRSLEEQGGDGGYPYFSVVCDYCSRHRRGVVEGHQLGLCQRGAAAMGDSGSDFRAILEHYYPGTYLLIIGAGFPAGAP